MSPAEQKELFGLNQHISELMSLYDQYKMPNKILLSGKKGVGKSTLAYHLINYIFSKSEEFAYDKLGSKINENNKSFRLIQNKSHPNFYLINLVDEKKKN